MTRRFIPKFTSQRKLVSVGAVRSHKVIPEKPSMAHHISFVPPPMWSATSHYVALEVDNETFTRMRHTTQLNWRLSPNPASSLSSEILQGWGTLDNSIGGSQQIPTGP